MNRLGCLRGTAKRQRERNTERSGWPQRFLGGGWGQEAIRKEGWKGASFVEQNVVITLLLAGKCSAWSWAQSLGNWEAGNELQIEKHSASPLRPCMSLRLLEIIQLACCYPKTHIIPFVLQWIPSPDAQLKLEAIGCSATAWGIRSEGKCDH